MNIKKIKKISKHNLPDGEVVAYNGEDILTGFLSKDKAGNVSCDLQDFSIHNCTHYIPVPDIIKLFEKNAKAL